MDTKSYRMLPNQTMSEIQIESTEYASNTRPLPSNLKEYLPFACGQLGINCSVIIQVERDVIVSNKMERQRQRSQTVTQSNPNHHINLSALQEVTADVIEEEIDRGVIITAIYDIQDKLTQLQIGGPFKKPRKLYQILSHIIAFFPYLSSIKVLPPIDKYSAYEIGKMLTISNISDITLDGCFVSEANFYILLEGNVTLKRLSLARCNITDCVLQNITQRLEYSTEASKFLSILILSSNKITDEGAQHISKMLRSNINLCYLNLADNSITDDGATSILNALMEFEITEDELRGYRARYTEYLLQKLKRVETLPEVKPVEKEQKPKMKTKKRQISKTPSILTTKNNSSEKDIQKVEFADPFHNFYFVDGKICCKGNHYLQCLNLEYNDLSYKILEKIVQVLNYQKYLNEKPRGILNIRLEGNLLPRFCAEYEQIDELIIEAVDSQIVTPVEQRKKKSK